MFVLACHINTAVACTRCMRAVENLNYSTTVSRVFKNTEFYGGGETSENSLNEPAELSLRCLAKTENDHCAAPCDTGVGDEGVLLKDRKPDDAIQRQGLVGLRPGRPREGPPCPTRSQSVLRHPTFACGPALGGGPPPGGYSSPGWQRQPLPYTVQCLPSLPQLWHKNNLSLISY